MEWTAYDYGAQRWVRGEVARLLLLERYRDEVEALAGPAGRLYHAATVRRDDPRTLAHRLADARDMVRLATAGA